MSNNTTTSTYSKNIPIHYLFTFLKSLDTTRGIWVLYLASKGLTLFEIGLLEGIFHITSFLMETPTGAIADLFGRKMSRLIGVGIAITSAILMILSNQFLFFAISFVLSALSYNFESGANEALVYDSLLYDKKEKRYMKVAGNSEIIFQVTNIIALLIGGAVGNIEYKYAYYLSIGLSILALAVGLFFKEPPTHNSKTKNEPQLKQGFWDSIINQYKASFLAVKNSKKLTYLIVLTSLVSASTTLSFYYLQLGWKNNGITPLSIGIFLAISSFGSAIAAYYAEKIDEKLGASIILKLFPLLLAIAIFFLFFIKYAIIPFMLIISIECIVWVASRDYINKIIPSEQRATILSFESVVFSAIMIAIFPLFGYLSDLIKIEISFLLLGVLMLIISLFNLRSTID